jgi:hypothetical protein
LGAIEAAKVLLDAMQNIEYKNLIDEMNKGPHR